MPLEIGGAEVTISKKKLFSHFGNLPCFAAWLLTAFNLISFSHSPVYHMFLHRLGRGIDCLYAISLLLFLLPPQFFARLLADFKPTLKWSHPHLSLLSGSFPLYVAFCFKTIIATICLFILMFCLFLEIVEVINSHHFMSALSTEEQIV